MKRIRKRGTYHSYESKKNFNLSVKGKKQVYKNTSKKKTNIQYKDRRTYEWMSKKAAIWNSMMAAQKRSKDDNNNNKRQTRTRWRAHILWVYMCGGRNKMNSRDSCV